MLTTREFINRIKDYPHLGGRIWQHILNSSNDQTTNILHELNAKDIAEITDEQVIKSLLRCLEQKTNQIHKGRLEPLLKERLKMLVETLGGTKALSLIERYLFLLYGLKALLAITFLLVLTLFLFPIIKDPGQVDQVYATLIFGELIWLVTTFRQVTGFSQHINYESDHLFYFKDPKRVKAVKWVGCVAGFHLFSLGAVYVSRGLYPLHLLSYLLTAFFPSYLYMKRVSFSPVSQNSGTGLLFLDLLIRLVTLVKCLVVWIGGGSFYPLVVVIYYLAAYSLVFKVLGHKRVGTFFSKCLLSLFFASLYLNSLMTVLILVNTQFAFWQLPLYISLGGTMVAFLGIRLVSAFRMQSLSDYIGNSPYKLRVTIWEIYFGINKKKVVQSDIVNIWLSNYLLIDQIIGKGLYSILSQDKELAVFVENWENYERLLTDSQSTYLLAQLQDVRDLLAVDWEELKKASTPEDFTELHQKVLASLNPYDIHLKSAQIIQLLPALDWKLYQYYRDHQMVFDEQFADGVI